MRRTDSSSHAARDDAISCKLGMTGGRQCLVLLGMMFLGGLVLTAIWTKSLLSIAEQRYVSVAWEMWHTHQYLVPHLNGSPYADKPPLLFWLICAGWQLFGVNSWWPQLLPGLFGLINVLLTWRLANLLWPESKQDNSLAPLLLIGIAIWNVFLTAVMFDTLLTAGVLLALCGLIVAACHQRKTGFIWFAIGMGLGFLAKGPVVFLFTLLPATLAPFWLIARPVRWSRWYINILIAALVAILIALAWIIPAVMAGGEVYRTALLYKQTVGRLTAAGLLPNIHAHWIGWYLLQLPLWLLPYVVFPWIWRSAAAIKTVWRDTGIRFVSVTLLVVFILFCIIRGKQIYYLLPLIPLLALLFSQLLAKRSVPENYSLSLWAALVFLGGAGLCSLPFFTAYYLPLASLPNISPIVGISLLLLGGWLYWQQPRSVFIAILCSSSSMILISLIVLVCIIRPLSLLSNIQPIADQVARLERAGYPIAYVGTYYGQYNFLGRLKKPLLVIDKKEVIAWANEHPEGWIVAKPHAFQESPAWMPEVPLSSEVLRNFWRAAQLIKKGDNH